jgi:hypothetical protein
VITAWWTAEPHANPAIACEPSHVVVLDVDPRHGGDASLARLETDIGAPLETAHVRTGSGGDHFIFEANGTPIKSGKLDGYPGIDIKAKGGYVVAVGALHASGQRYAWADTQEPQPIPAALLALLTREPAREPRRPAPDPCRPAGGKPGDDFNARGSWDGPGMLISHGWKVDKTQGAETFWTRPDKPGGTSATTNYQDSGLFYPWTTSTQFDAERGYSKFAVYAILNHGGDFTAAARDLAAQGYGEPPRAPGSTASGPDTSGTASSETSQNTGPDAPWWESGPSFARHADTPAPIALVEGVLAGDGFTVWHGDPRTFKTWHAEDVMLSLVAGVPALGGLPTGGPMVVLYVSNEDPARRTADRLVKLARGKGLTGLPEHLLLAVHSGLWLDDEDSQAKLITLVKREGVGLVVLDPLRSVTAGVDQGPRDLQPFARFLRLLMTCSGCAVLGLHHDVKPLAGVNDSRKRAHRASGGGLFSIADAPVHFERVGDDPTVLLHPSGWKHSDTPGPLETRLTVTDDGATLTAVATTSASASDRELHAKILDFVTGHPDTSGNKIAAGLRARREVVTRALEDLAAAGQVDSRPGPRGAQFWFRLDGDRFRGANASDGSGQVS